jgi:hypothetical protein
MRTDCHVHLDRIGQPHKTPPPTVAELVAYAKREDIGLFGAIYEREDTLASFQAASLPLFPFFWVRTPLCPQVPPSAKGLKLHPYIERYAFTIENIRPTLLVAIQRQLPLLVHTDDREPAFSRGSLVAQVAGKFPELRFIMAHSGSYAPGIVGQLGKSLVTDQLIHELVSEAIGVAKQLPNVFLETSILASRVKAALLAREAPLDKLLIGTDFPICAESFGSVLFQEQMLIEQGLSRDDLERIHKNALIRFPIS